MKLYLIKPNKLDEYTQMLGLNFWTYNLKRRSPSRGIVRERGFYLTIDLFWYRMGINMEKVS